VNIETKERLVAAGTWERYSRLKVKYINEGLATKVAEQKALMEVERPHPAGGDPYRRLLLAAPPGNCSEREAAQFVFEHAASEPADIDEAAVPSRGAVALLKWVHASPANASNFYTSMWTKLMPTKSQLDAEARYSDDGNRSIQLLDRLEQMLDEPSEDEPMPGMREDSAGERVSPEPEVVPGGVQELPMAGQPDEEVRDDSSGLHGVVRETGRARSDHDDTSGSW
jgi:hypothetical protein